MKRCIVAWKEEKNANGVVTKLSYTERVYAEMYEDGKLASEARLKEIAIITVEVLNTAPGALELAQQNAEGANPRVRAQRELEK